jgi:hypothetical protein
MGEYWPTSGYCTSADFVASGSGCFPPTGGTVATH